MDRITHCFTRRRKHPTEQSLRQNRSRRDFDDELASKPRTAPGFGEIVDHRRRSLLAGAMAGLVSGGMNGEAG